MACLCAYYLHYIAKWPKTTTTLPVFQAWKDEERPNFRAVASAMGKKMLAAREKKKLNARQRMSTNRNNEVERKMSNWQ